MGAIGTPSLNVITTGTSVCTRPLFINQLETTKSQPTVLSSRFKNKLRELSCSSLPPLRPKRSPQIISIEMLGDGIIGPDERAVLAAMEAFHDALGGLPFTNRSQKQAQMRVQIDKVTSMMLRRNTSKDAMAAEAEKTAALMHELEEDGRAIGRRFDACHALELSSVERADALNIYWSSAALQRRWTLKQHLWALRQLKRRDSITELVNHLIETSVLIHPHDLIRTEMDEAADAHGQAQPENQAATGNRRSRRRNRGKKA